jgi:hypothetical protein
MIYFLREEKMKKLITILIVLLLCSTVLHAQNYAVDKGARIFAGTFSYSSIGGDDITHRYNILSLTPSFNYFVASHIFLGLAVAYNRTWQGDYSQSDIGIGPRLGYAMGNRNSSTFPFLLIGARYRSDSQSHDSYSSKTTGSSIILAAGMIHALKTNLGTICQAAYHIMSSSANGDSYSTNMIVISIGIAALCY